MSKKQSLSDLMRAHDKKLAEACLKHNKEVEEKHLKKNPNASRVFHAPHVIRYSSEVDYFG